MKPSSISYFTKIILTLALTGGLVLAAAAAPKKVLVVSTTTGFRHSSIGTSEKIIAKLGQESGAFTVDFASQPANEPRSPKKPADLKPDADDAAKAKYKEAMEKFKDEEAQSKAARAEWNAELKQVLRKLSPENLKGYDAVIFANTTGDLPLPDPQGFIDWVKAGHGFVGMHSASDTFHGFRPYIEMIGSEFLTHGAQVGVEAINQDSNHPACKHLPPSWAVHDEIYIMKNFTRANVHGLLGLDKHPNTKAPGDHPIAWCKEFGKGRVFYTSLGHREDVWDDEWSKDRKNSKEVAKAYQQHILGGIKWALGLEPGDGKPQTTSK